MFVRGNSLLLYIFVLLILGTGREFIVCHTLEVEETSSTPLLCAAPASSMDAKGAATAAGRCTPRDSS